MSARLRVRVPTYGEMKVHCCTKCRNVWVSNNTAASTYINKLCPACIAEMATLTWHCEIAKPRVVWTR